MEAYIGSLMIFAGNFAPVSWAFCQGQLMSIAENTTLFAILGTTYGGDGQNTFALPDLRGRAAVGAGQGLSNYQLGQSGGTNMTTMTVQNLPAHTHTVTMSVKPGSSISAASANPDKAVYAPDGGGNLAFAPTANNTMAPYPATITTSVTGGSIPIDNRNPYLAMCYIICLEGIFPSRN